MRMNKTKIISF